AQRVAQLRPRIEGLIARLAITAEAQNRYLASIAIRELESQKERLAAYSLQARFALASIYDRASSGAQGGREWCRPVGAPHPARAGAHGCDAPSCSPLRAACALRIRRSPIFGIEPAPSKSAGAARRTCF